MRARLMAVCITLLCAFSIASCSLPGPDIEKQQMPSDIDVKPPNVPKGEETVRGNDDPPVVKLQLEKSLRQTNLREAEELPSTIQIGKTNLNNVPVMTALQAVLADSDITVLWESPELQNRPVTLMNLKGPLPIVVSRVCRAAKILCAYRNGALEVMNTDTFVIAIPAIAANVAGGSGGSAGSVTSSTSNSIADAIGTLVGGKVTMDSSGGTLIYTADAEGHERVQSYLEELRNGRPLIVLQLNIWEVQLENNREVGINWSQLIPPDIGGLRQNALINSISNVKSVATGEGISLGAVFSGYIDANTLVGFLSKQGKVQNISSPQMTFVSGTSAKFEIGGNQRYVAQIGTQNTISGTSTTANSVVTTDELKTGLTISATGTYESGVVFATMELKTSDLVQFQEFPTGSVNLKLPQTTDRTVQTVLRVRPGDNLVLAGLKKSNDTRNREGLPTFIAGDIPMSGSNDSITSELVILVRPSVVFFSDRESADIKAGQLPKTSTRENPNAEQVKAPVAPPAPEPPRPPSPLQNEFGGIVKMYEDTDAPLPAPQAPRPSPLPTATAPGVPENIRPNGGHP